MSQTTIQVLEAPCGRGKTRGYAVPRMLTEGGMFLYVAPRKEILDDVEDQITEFYEKHPELRPARFKPFLRIDSDNLDENTLPTVRAEIQKRFKSPDVVGCKIVAITHAALWMLPPGGVASRKIIIDEMPGFIELKWEHPKDLLGLENDGLLASDEASRFVALTDEGVARVKGPAVGDIDKAKKKVLQWIHRAQTKYMPTGWMMQQLDPDVFRNAAEVVVTAAMPGAGYFPEYCDVNGFTTAAAELGGEGRINTRPHLCANTEILYIYDTPNFGSLLQIKRRARELKALLPRLRWQGDGLTEGRQYVAAINKGFHDSIGASLAKANIESPGIRGVNDYRHCTSALWLAATQPDPKEIETVRALSDKRSAKEIVESRHVENMYQFVMRCQLRDEGGETKPTKILVLTRGDALALNRILNARAVQKCQAAPPPQADHRTKRRKRAKAAA